jgi:hypothetical protein
MHLSCYPGAQADMNPFQEILESQREIFYNIGVVEASS